MSSQGVSRTDILCGLFVLKWLRHPRMMGHKRINYGNSKTFQGYSST